MKNPFTLVELLVVVTVIMLLLSLLLPGLKSSYEYAKTTVCLSNMRQSMGAAHVYATDNREHVFLISKLPGDGWKPWVYPLAITGGYMPAGSKAALCPSEIPDRWSKDSCTTIYGVDRLLNSNVVPGTMSYCKDKNTYELAMSYGWTDSYTLNCRKLNRIASPQSHHFLIDTWVGWGPPGPGQYFDADYLGVVAARHNLKCDAVMWDGHAASLDRKETRDLGVRSALFGKNKNYQLISL